MLFVREDPLFTALDAELHAYSITFCPPVNSFKLSEKHDKMGTMIKTAVTIENEDMIEVMHEAGADEVILALENGTFSALGSYAGDEIIRLAEKIHACHMQVSVLMNRLFPEDELASFANQMIWLLNEGIDHIICADPGLLYHAMEKGYASRLVFDPMTMMTNSRDALFYKQLGLSSVAVSQLLTAGEIMDIASQVPDCSLCVFGHQMMSVSARPLLSAYGERQDLAELKNRRDLSIREEKREEQMPVYENDYAAMIASDYVQDSLDYIVPFAEAGISRFVLDGAFLSPEFLRDALIAVKEVLQGNDTAKETFRKKYSSEKLSDGYYGIKTIQ